MKRWLSVTRESAAHLPLSGERRCDVQLHLIYELAVLKPLATPLLKQITPEDPQYSEARRLLRFLDYFVEVDDWSVIPCNSILQEFIGGSCFD